MNWILDEVKESIKEKIGLCESFMEVCDTQMENYESRYETNNIGETVNHEYWRVCKIRTAYEVNHLKEILQEIDEMMLEEVKQFEELEEETRALRADAQI